MGDGLLVPSSFRRIDGALKDEIEETDGEERIAIILKKCFGIDAKVDALKACDDLPVIELEEDLYVLELERVGKAKCATAQKSILVAAAIASAYVDLELDGKCRVFLPFEEKRKELTLGAVYAKAILPIEVFVGVAEEDLDKCQSWLESLSVPHASDVICVAANNECVYETMNNFNDYDDYVFDVVSALGASAFESVEDEGDAPSIVIVTASPYDFPLQTLSAFGVKAKDEKEAIKKLKTLFAL